MELLSYDALHGLVEKGVIRNVDRRRVNSSSIDVTLGSTILQEVPLDLSSRKTVSLRDRDQLHMRTVVLDPVHNPRFILAPDEFCLAGTNEEFHLPLDISAQYMLKSSMARIGLEHLNAGWCDAGWHGSVLTLELKNMTRFHDIALRAGDAIGQVVFFRHAPVPPAHSYAARGRYNGDKSVTQTKKEI